jgi:Ca2+-binding EF-hand superfamily protein
MNKGETAGETIGSGSEQDGTRSVTSRRQSMVAQYFAKLDAMRHVVAKYSPDGDDLHPDGVAQMALELGITLDGTQLADALTEMDGDGDGSISPMEFEAWIKRQIMHTKHVASQRTKPEARSQADDEGDEISSDLRPAGEAGSVKSGVSIFGYGTNVATWAAFRRLDVDASGTLDFEEFSALSQELRLQLSKKEMTEGWRTQLDPLETGAVCFEDFVVFFNHIKATEWRKVLRKISTYFQRADINGDGCA